MPSQSHIYIYIFLDGKGGTEYRPIIYCSEKSYKFYNIK